MGVPFFFAENISSGDNETELDEETSKHIVQVLRMKGGERIRLTDGKGNLIDGEIAAAHKRHCTVSKIASQFVDRPLPVLTIAISLTKNAGRFEWFLEKATELGTAAIIPMICERTEKQHARFERLVSICRSAMLQSGQAWMPEMHQQTAFSKVVEQASQAQKIFGHITRDVKKLADVIDRKAGSHIILIGPEGDFSDAEVSLARGAGFESASFGRTILRVETAGVYAAVVHSAIV